MKVNNIKEFNDICGKYVEYSKKSIDFVGMEKHTIDISTFKKDSEIILCLAKELSLRRDYGISRNVVFLELVRNSLDMDNDFNLDFFLKDDEVDDLVRVSLIRNSFYRDISIFNDLIGDKSSKIRAISASNCSVDKLNLFLKDKDSNIRLIAYQRLGPVNTLDKALNDKVKKIRRWGIESSPFFYKKLSDLKNERSTGNYVALIQKVRREDLPFFLSPSFLQNASVGSYVKKRIRDEIKKRLS